MYRINWEDVKKFDRPGPRYTSYPTAPLFNEQIAAPDFRTELVATRDSRAPLSLYLHAPFCHTLCWYCGCNMLVDRNQERMNAHLDLVEREMAMLRPQLHPQRPAQQVHLGGGTPNYMEDGRLLKVMDALRRHFEFSADAEISIETDPRQINPAKLDEIIASGFNRISMGVQDLDPEVQRYINRIQPYEMVADCVEGFRARGIDSINMDLIYGLPGQTVANFAAGLEKIIGLAPDRIALFNFAYVPGLRPHMKLIKPEDMPAPDVKLEILATTVERLRDAGYEFIGMDHFAKPGDPLTEAWRNGELHRNFQGYTTKGGLEMIGFGMSAISMLDGLYVQNHSKIAAYDEAIASGELATWRGYRLTQDDRLRRNIINRLMCRYLIDLPLIESETGEDFDEYFPGVGAQLDELTADGLLTRTARVFTVTEMGRLLLRNIAMVFDAYLPDMLAQGKARFSRTV